MYQATDSCVRKSVDNSASSQAALRVWHSTCIICSEPTSKHPSSSQPLQILHVKHNATPRVAGLRKPPCTSSGFHLPRARLPDAPLWLLWALPAVGVGVAARLWRRRLFKVASSRAGWPHVSLAVSLVRMSPATLQSVRKAPRLKILHCTHLTILFATRMSTDKAASLQV